MRYYIRLLFKVQIEVKQLEFFFFFCFANKRKKNNPQSREFHCIIYCSVTNYHKCRDLKQCTFIFSQYLWVRVWHGFDMSSARLQSMCGPGLGSRLSLYQGKITFQTRMIVGGIHALQTGTEDLGYLLPIGWMLAALGSLPSGPPQGSSQPDIWLLERQQGGRFLSKTNVTVFCNVIMKMTTITFALLYSLEASPNHTQGEEATRGHEDQDNELWTHQRLFAHPLLLKIPQRYYSLDKQRQFHVFLNHLRQDTSSFLFCH